MIGQSNPLPAGLLPASNICPEFIYSFHQLEGALIVYSIQQMSKQYSTNRAMAGKL